MSSKNTDHRLEIQIIFNKDLSIQASLLTEKITFNVTSNVTYPVQFDETN